MKKRQRKKQKPTAEANTEVCEAVKEPDAVAEAIGEASAEVGTEQASEPVSMHESEAKEDSPLDALSPGERAALIAALASRIRREARKVEEETVRELASDPRYAEMESRYEEMQALSAEYPFLCELSVRDRLIAAYHIDRSLRPTRPSPEEQLTDLLKNPAMLSALSARFAELMAEKRSTLPPMAAHRGTGVPPADTKRAPRDLREASDAAKKFLGFAENKQKRSM